jgi:CheY-like chemotaxis protein
MLTNEQFLETLRGALKHLYDPYYLRRSPLIAILKLQDQPDAVPSLQRILREAIEKLEPQVGATYSSQAQLVYDLLTYRYVQQFSQDEVANQLGMSVRHLRREQNTATYILATELWKTYHLGERAFEAPIQETEKNEPDESNEEDALAFYRSAASPETLQVQELVRAAIELARPLAERYAVGVQLQQADNLPQVVSLSSAMHQLLLNLLNIAIFRAAQAVVDISVGVSLGKVEVSIVCPVAKLGAFPGTASEKSNQEMALRLAEICGCKLAFNVEPDTVRAVFSIPTAPQYHVFIIDDNPDNFRLMQHLANGTRYRLSVSHDPALALSRVEQDPPQLIVLDVMMPNIDGWEVLGRLRRHPASESIPVIICTILAHEEMALALGASGFIHKPITRENLLAELDRQALLLAKTPR